VEIVFHAHHAVISDDLRARAERAVHKAAARLHRVVDATVRFEEDGPTRRVEIVLHAPKQPPVVALGEGRLFGPALSAATARLQALVGRVEVPHARSRRAGGPARRLDGAPGDGELDRLGEALGDALGDRAVGDGAARGTGDAELR
jgi:hypothetical protein